MQTCILGVSKVSKFSFDESKRFIAIRNFELERHGNESIQNQCSKLPKQKHGKVYRKIKRFHFYLVSCI